jgi:hypothetical protein
MTYIARRRTAAVLAALGSALPWAVGAVPPDGPGPRADAPTAVLTARLPSASDARSEREVAEVVERFRSAVIAKDEATLRALFLPGHRSWFSVAGDAQGRPRLHPGSVEEFARSVAASPRREEERFANLRIHADRWIASVHFDYDFLVDDRRSHGGQETWQLLRTEQGWRIASLVYSIERRP